MTYTSQIIYNNKKYQITFNNDHERLFFLIDQNETPYILEDTKEIEELNRLFNSSYCALNISDIKIKINEIKKIKRKDFLCDLVTSAVIGALLISPFYINIIYKDNKNITEKLSEIEGRLNTKNYSLEDILGELEDNYDIYETLSLNKYLSNEEKELIIEFYLTYREKLSNYDLKVFNENMKKLKIKYEDENDFKKYKNDMLIAYYNSDNNCIVIKEGIDIKSVIFHELGHTTNTINYNDEKANFVFNSYGVGINEGINSIITYELFDNEIPYVLQAEMCYLLSVAVGKETLVDCYNSKSIFDLENILSNIYGSNELASELITLIDEINPVMLDDFDFVNDRVYRIKELIITYELNKWYKELFFNDDINLEKCLLELDSFYNMLNKEIIIKGENISNEEINIYYEEQVRIFIEKVSKLYPEEVKNIDYSSEELLIKQDEYNKLTNYETGFDSYKLILK